MVRYKSMKSSSNPPPVRAGLAKKAAEASARRLAAREADAEGLLTSPRRTKRQKFVAPSQLIAESQSLLSPVAHDDESTGSPLTSAVEVNVESQLTQGTDFPSDSSVSSVSVTAADGATLVAAVADSATNTVTANSTMAAVADTNNSNDVVAPPDDIVPPTSLNEVLRSPAILLDREDWFKLLQDSGTLMSGAEKEMYLPTNPKPKKKTRMIAHSSEDGSFFYSLLYQLAAALFDQMNSYRTTFPHLPKQSSKTATIHKIGQWIAKKRIRYERADIHNIGIEVGFMDFILSPTYADQMHFFVLTQSTTWEYLFHLYGAKGEQKAVTVDDKVRVVGIIFQEDMRPFIQDMIGTSRASSVRAVLDAASGRKLYAMNRLHEHFIDREVVIHIPPGWETVDNMVSVDEINGEGAFEQFGNFNPNNEARIALDWTPADVTAIFGKVLSEYNAAMEKYTKGTGGGSGSHAMFAVWDEARSEQHKKWKERSVGWIAQYAGQMASLYLGVVLMWDAQFGYIFHARKDPMPDQCMIDDNNHCMIDDSTAGGGRGDNGEDSGGRDRNNDFRTPRVGTGRMQGSSSSKNIESLLNEIQVGKESLHATQHEMLQMMKAATTAGASGGPASFVSQIQSTLNVLKECKNDLRELQKRSKRLASNGADGDGKIRRLTNEIKKKRRLISTLEVTLDTQQEQLRAVTMSEAATAKGNRNDDDDDDYDDDSSGDDADDGTAE